MFYITLDLPLIRHGVDLSGISSTSVMVTWHPWRPDQDRGDGPVVYYNILYRETSHSRPRWMITKFNVSHTLCTSTSCSTELTQLKPYTEYEVGLRAARHGEGGLGSMSPLNRFRTLCAGLLSPFKSMVQNYSCKINQVPPYYI